MRNKNLFKNTKCFLLSTCLLLAAVMPASAKELEGYVVFLPIDSAVTYDVSDNHLSEEYSTDDYLCLVYDANEIVRFDTDSEKVCTIEGALDAEEFSSFIVSSNGNISFVMPEKDLMLKWSEEVVTEEVSEEDVTEESEATETETETEDAFETSAPAGDAEDGTVQ